MIQLSLAQPFEVDKNTWPPLKLTVFTPLLLMHHKGQRNLKQANAMAKLTGTGHIDSIPSIANNQSIPTHFHRQNSHESLKEALNDSTITKEIAEILVPLDNKCGFCFILIEGPPGIGKSFLLKEISYRWAKKQLLQTYKLVLLICLRDPMVQQAKLIDDLLQLYCKGDKRASEMISANSDQLLNNGGKDLILLLDGFDELPDGLQKHSLIFDILEGKVFPQCGVVLSSRPHASKVFHNTVILIVEILGFTEEDRKHCIEQAFKEKPHKATELSHSILITILVSIAFVLYLSMWWFYFIYISKDTLFLKILLICIIILFVLPFADILQNLVIPLIIL